ncbi:MAG TPA: hypothetical protein VGQ21_05310, partial [Thermoanaerobaculia bacterium]|nr:hypothetical protein [Thermoanaerobaculia bacterium]
GTRVGPISGQDFRTFTLTGNALTLTGPVTGMYFTAWNVDLKLETDVTLRGSDFHGALDLNGHNLTLLGLRTHPPTSIDGTIVGTGTLTIEGGDSIITKPSSFSGTVYVQNTCELDGSMPDANFVLLPEGNGEWGGARFWRVSAERL